MSQEDTFGLQDESGARSPIDSPTEYVIPDEMRQRIENTFTYHAPKGDQQRRYEGLRERAKVLAYMICAYVPPGREQSSALTKLEEAIFHANAGIARGE